MANGPDLRHCRAHHHLPLRARACRSCGADRRGEPAVPPQDHRQGGRRARAHRRDRHGGVRQDRHADPWAPRTSRRRDDFRRCAGGSRRACGREPASLRARHRRGGGEAAWERWCRHRASKRLRASVSSAVIARGRGAARLGRVVRGRQRRRGQRGLVPARLDGAGSLPLRRQREKRRGRCRRRAEAPRLSACPSLRGPHGRGRKSRARRRHRHLARRAEARRQDRLARSRARARAARC